ncbi:hypothetical protein BDM02DRAFT_3132668 [Thelephora ganbajun]|uniref:Uncharacterized protein n=1 Tax=Thelephora ganbajun TaxID=370292 RepID=A0ACB6Z1F2_THEGA|nr:hypothetical protein BDM02DRAFT_3132668 [Thelephora ganbajun]
MKLACLSTLSLKWTLMLSLILMGNTITDNEDTLSPKQVGGEREGLWISAVMLLTTMVGNRILILADLSKAAIFQQTPLVAPGSNLVTFSPQECPTEEFGVLTYLSQRRWKGQPSVCGLGHLVKGPPMAPSEVYEWTGAIHEFRLQLGNTLGVVGTHWPPVIWSAEAGTVKCYAYSQQPWKFRFNIGLGNLKTKWGTVHNAFNKSDQTHAWCLKKGIRTPTRLILDSHLPSSGVNFSTAGAHVGQGRSAGTGCKGGRWVGTE